MNYKKSDFREELQQNNFEVFIHGCNCSNGFGSGIAGIIAEVYPEVKKRYHQYTEKHLPEELLGTVYLNHVGDNYQYIINAYTQLTYGYKYGTKYVSYDAIDEAFKLIGDLYKVSNQKLCYPKIGSGLGGGNWEVIKEIIDHRLQGCDHTCIIL